MVRLRPRPWVMLAAAFVAGGPTAGSAAPLLEQISPTPSTIRMFNDRVTTVPAPPTSLLVVTGLVAVARRLFYRPGSR